MSSAADYFNLKALKSSAGYQLLEALWIHQVTEIEDTRDKAAKKATGESDWRYWAGQEKGFKLAMTALQRAMMQMEQEETELIEETNPETEKILAELRIKKESL